MFYIVLLVGSVIYGMLFSTLIILIFHPLHLHPLLYELATVHLLTSKNSHASFSESNTWYLSSLNKTYVVLFAS